MTPEITEKLLNYNGDDRIITFAEKKADVDKARESKPRICVKVEKFPRFSEAIRHFAPGDLILITGRSKSGKTLLAQTFTMDFQREHDISSLWFEYEVQPEMFLETFPEGTLPLIGYLPREMRSGSTNWLQERIEEALVKDEAKHGQRTLYAIFIDHVHYVFDIFKSKNPSIEIGQIIRQLKTIAIENDLIIFVMAHMRKSDLEEPSAYDGRDSSFLVAECDKALCMWRVKDEENTSILKLDVDRRTGALQKKFKLIKTPQGYLRELEELRDEPQEKKRRDWE